VTIELHGGRELARNIVGWAIAKRIPLSEALRQQTRLLFEKVNDYTPPWFKRKGENALVGDLHAAVRPLTEEKFRKPGIKKMIQERRFDLLTAFLKRISPSSGARDAVAVPFAPDLHTTQRNAQGRVAKNGQSRWATPDAPGEQSYSREKKKDVGKASGGWAPAIEGSGGRVAEWIGRHRGQGAFIDQSKHLTEPYMTGINRSPWAGNPDAPRQVARAIAFRNTNITTAIANALEHSARSSGLH
jgi:hypothetical protein